MSTLAEIDTAPATEPTAPPSAGEPPIVRILPPGGWEMINVRELWRFRELGYFLVWRDVKVRYKQTLLGAAWAVLQPALMMVVFTVFFGRMAQLSSGDLPYPLFAYLGLLPWTMFATAVTNAGNSVVGSERLITKIYFPRLAIPLASAGAAVVDFLIAFGLLIVLMAIYRVWPGVGLLLLPVIMLGVLLAAVGVGTLLAAMNVRFRDFRYVIPFMMQLWMFATPSIYMDASGAAASNGWVARLMAVNPMTGLIAAFRAACTGDSIPWGGLGLSLLFGSVVFVAGMFYFRRVERGFADVI